VTRFVWCAPKAKGITDERRRTLIGGTRMKAHLWGDGSARVHMNINLFVESFCAGGSWG
jgi:hypothetical protein